MQEGAEENKERETEKRVPRGSPSKNLWFLCRQGSKAHHNRREERRRETCGRPGTGSSALIRLTGRVCEGTERRDHQAGTQATANSTKRAREASRGCISFCCAVSFCFQFCHATHGKKQREREDGSGRCGCALDARGDLHSGWYPKADGPWCVRHPCLSLS